MNFRELFKFDTISKKIFIPSLLFLVALFVILTAINIAVNRSLLHAQMDARGNAMANYMAKTSVFYYVNFDLGAMEGFVQEVVKDPDVAHAVFYDETGKPLTTTAKMDADPATLMVYEREVKDDLGNTLGRLSLGYSPNALAEGVRKGVWLMLAAMTAALVALLSGITLFVRKVITRPLNGAITVANRLTEGDLTVRIDANTSEDEIGRLAIALHNMVTKLKTILSNVSGAAQDVNASAHSISVATTQQAGIAVEQSAAVVEITATMEELSSSSTQIAEHSKSVVDLATRTWDTTKKGSAAAEAVMLKMNEIHDDSQNSINEIVELGKKSREISKVMEIINTIADQTKLIAFNAALEASSAGEAGKRFGVVAVEIRRLADSVMESTGEIEAKISEIQDSINRLVLASEKGSNRIREGLDFTSQTATSLLDVVDSALATQEAAKQISLSTQQQKTASSHVVTALREIASGANQTSDSIKQISSVSRKLTELSDTLKELIDVFKLGEEKAMG